MKPYVVTSTCPYRATAAPTAKLIWVLYTQPLQGCCIVLLAGEGPGYLTQNDPIVNKTEGQVLVILSLSAVWSSD